MKEADFGKVVELVDLIREQFEVERKKKEIEEKFIETFGIKPKVVNVSSAEATFRDSELPEEIHNKIRDLLDDLGMAYDCFDLHLTTYRTECEENHEWKADIVGHSVVLTKVEDGIKCKLQILAIWEDRI